MGSDGFTPSRGAPCQYFWRVDSMKETEMNPTAYAWLRGVTVAGQMNHTTALRGWPSANHQIKTNQNHASAGSRNSLEAEGSLRKRFYKTSHRGVVNRNALSWTQPSSLCGFTTRSRKETGQQEASYYGKIQLLSDRSRQKRVSTKPVSLPERLTPIMLSSLYLSNAPITRRLTPASDYDLIRATTTRHDTIGKETEYIILIAAIEYLIWSTREVVCEEKHTLIIKIR